MAKPIIEVIQEKLLNELDMIDKKRIVNYYNDRRVDISHAEPNGMGIQIIYSQDGIIEEYSNEKIVDIATSIHFGLSDNSHIVNDSIYTILKEKIEKIADSIKWVRFLLFLTIYNNNVN